MKLSRPIAVAAASASAVLLPFAGSAQAAQVPAAPVTPADGVECGGEAGDVPVTVELTDAPDALVAGEWDELTVRWTNAGDEPLANLYVYADLWAYTDEEEADSWPVDIEWQAPGGWQDVPFESDLAAGHFAIARDVQPGDDVEVRLRVQVTESPDGFADVSFGSMNVLEGDACRWGEDAGVTFDVEGNLDAVEPVPTDEPTDEPTAAPTDEPTQSATPAPAPAPTGPELADTGADSSLPLIGGAAALALAAGAGVVLAARRKGARTDA
ncbi:LAETG motif-containing sortase-dependent surface protein [Streptomyces sp. MS19]|uniref:LAETG motif-containing sortase-dependent surface protein n=1 Tax=Streptomyces sp. MS19 TaxID=3385972 RepID=UPI0039A1CD0E